PYYTLTDHMMATGLFMVSNLAWKKLPDDLKKIVLEAGHAASRREQQFDMDMSAKYMEKLKAEGIKINEIDKGPWIERSLPLQDRLAKKVDAEKMLGLIRQAGSR